VTIVYNIHIRTQFTPSQILGVFFKDKPILWW